MTYVLMTDSLSLQERHKAITALSLTWLVGTVVGPIMSGGFTDKASWRWVCQSLLLEQHELILPQDLLAQRSILRLELRYHYLLHQDDL